MIFQVSIISHQSLVLVFLLLFPLSFLEYIYIHSLAANATQVEDTLNNSNDLFLTFRKEMEEMSKKTKRLEKENSNLTRKHDLTNQNILKMAEERTKSVGELDGLRKKNEKLTSIINQMQKQGRGVAAGLGMSGEGEGMEGELYHAGEDDEGTESEYDYGDEEGEDGDGEEEEDGDEQSEGGDYEDTEEDVPGQQGSQPFGPVPPPTLALAAVNINGVSMAVNGIKH